MNSTTVSEHYDLLVDENNDPVCDPAPLQAYMEKWDGPQFLGLLGLTGNETVLEIGVGTGRLAMKTAPRCKRLYGIDLSEKTVRRAGENLAHLQNVELICADFMTHRFVRRFEVIYSSLTLMHIEQKQACFEKVFSLLEHGGRFVLSIDKNRAQTLDCGSRWLTVFPDDPASVAAFAKAAGFVLSQAQEAELAHLFCFHKP
ncbi:MAG: class I SAM-dependent methyltransferase [Clostridia bacterium]|nr:class I SAM-dependent methyltransferase [Clostridia bacterium]